MKYCKSCKLDIENNVTQCPLCHSILSEKDNNFNNDYPIIKKDYALGLVRNLILFFMVCSSIISVLINIYAENKTSWSFISIAGSVYLYFSTLFFLKKGRNYGLFILVQVFLISLVVFAIDFSFGLNGWSINYVIPFIIISGSLSVFVFSIVKPFVYKEYMVYLLVIALLGLFPLIFILKAWTKVPWTSATCVVYSTLTVIGMLIFSRRHVNSELKRRLHF